jgi:heme/copper-type cytochrome/quinol oxidase subunit 2
MSAQVSKPVLGLVVLALIVAAASLTQAFVLSGALSEQTKKVEELSSQLGTVSSQLGSQAPVTEARTGTRTIYMVAMADLGGDGYDKFLPETITVLKGDKVKLILNNTDEMDHGLAIDAYGINKVVKGHETITIEFVADKAGVFEFYCTIPCGPGHSQMTGQLIVLG